MRFAVPILLLCILGASVALDANQQIIQDVFNGVFEENHLVDPTTIVECIDPATAAKVVAFAPGFLKKASSVLSLPGAITDATNFVKTLNPQVATCLVGNTELVSLLADYDISGITIAQITSFATTHLSTFTNEFAQVYKEFQSAQYNQLGQDVAGFAHKIINQLVSKFFSLLSASNDANTAILQQILNGFYEQNNLADPTTIIPCVDTTTAANIVNFVPGFLKKASSVLTIASALTSAEAFVKTLNPAVATCLQGNAEGLELATVFDISGINQQAAISWATSHVSTVTGEAATLNKLWSAGNYNGFGNNASSFAHTVLSQISGVHKLNASNDANTAILQQILNGFYEQNNLADPSTIIPCVDTTTAANIVSFVPGFLKKASSVLTIASALTSAEAFVKTLNPAVATCLQGNAEGLELATVFDISGINQQAAISWATSHVSTVTGEAATLSKLWAAGNYNGFGNNASSFAHTVLSQISGVHAVNASNLEILQQFYNGIYNQQGLANPGFISVYPDAAAADFVAFAPSFLKKASSILTINAAFTDLQNFTNAQGQKYPEIGQQIAANPDYVNELQALSTALGVKNPDTVQQTLKDYITSNLSSTTSAFGDANTSWKGSNFTKSGSQVSAWLKKALAKNALTFDEQIMA